MAEQMDVVQSLFKISRELNEYSVSDMTIEELRNRLSAASWLIAYIASALDVELQHAAERGRSLTHPFTRLLNTKSMKPEEKGIKQLGSPPLPPRVLGEEP